MVKADDAAVGVTSQMHSNLRFAANTLQTSGRIDTVDRARDGLDRSAPRRLVDDRSERRLAAADGRAGAGRWRVWRRSTASTCRRSGRRSTSRRAATSTRPRPCRWPTARRAVDEALAASEKARVISAGFHQAQAAGRRRGDQERQLQLRAQHHRQPGHDRPHARRRRIGVFSAQPHRRPPRRHAAHLPRSDPPGAGIARRADHRRRQLSGHSRGASGRRPDRRGSR